MLTKSGQYLAKETNGNSHHYASVRQVKLMLAPWPFNELNGTGYVRYTLHSSLRSRPLFPHSLSFCCAVSLSSQLHITARLLKVEMMERNERHSPNPLLQLAVSTQGLQVRKDGSLAPKFVSVAKAALLASRASAPRINSNCMLCASVESYTLLTL